MHDPQLPLALLGLMAIALGACGITLVLVRRQLAVITSDQRALRRSVDALHGRLDDAADARLPRVVVAAPSPAPASITLPLHVIHDGSVLRYQGPDAGAAETVWMQLERHAVPGAHTWHVNGEPHQTRTIASTTPDPLTPKD